MKSLTRKAACAALLGALLAGGAIAQAGAPLPPVRNSGPVEYLSGGIGADESAAIQSASRQWPLALEFAIKDRQHADFAADVASGVAGDPAVHRAIAPLMGGEDFSYMLEARPGAFIFIGNGDTANLHHPAYDFNDEASAYGVSYWVKLAETALAPA